MLRMQSGIVLCGVMMMSLSGVASGAIRNLVGGAGIGGRADSLEFPWMDSYSLHGPEYSSFNMSALVAGAWANSAVSTTSTPDPDYLTDWPLVCGSFTGVGSSSANVSASNGAAATAGASVNLSFDSDGIFGMSFKSTGTGRITIAGSNGYVYADCFGNNEIIGFLPPGRYTVTASTNSAVSAPYASGEYWPWGYPSSASEQGSFEFTVPTPGGIVIAALGVVWASRRRRV